MVPGAPLQQSLLALGEPAPGNTSRILRTHLDERSWIDAAPAWLAGSDELFLELAQTLPWESHRRPMYERIVDVPRLTHFGSALESLPPAIAETASLLGDRYGVDFDAVGCNLYRDGRDSVAWHGDRVRLTQRDPLVAIVSLGEPRPFLLRPRGGGPSRKYRLGGGDLLVMGGACQHRWEHAVPKVARAGPRISVTFRHGEEPDDE